MFKGLATKLPLVVTFCLLNTANFSPVAAVETCELNTVKASYKIADRTQRDRDRRYYNQNESKGSDGRAGREGRNGENQTISANGSPVNLDLSGTNGEDGEDGENAFRPRCGREERAYSNSDIRAADGGDGGNGGKGGDGGNGGSLTVYFRNLADLQNIFVRTVGGEGGRGGRGGEGTRGCNCRRSRWEEKTCTGRQCTNKTYRCYDGTDGRDGSYGGDGKQGSLGTLSIINSQEPLQSDQPTIKTPISQLTNQQFNLSKNKWNLRQGATALLAPGSVIADQYREFDRRLESTLKLIWQEKQPISNFADQNVTLTLNDNEQIEISFPEDMWVDGNVELKNQLTEYTVNYAIPKQEVTKLAVAEFSGTGSNLNLKIVDLARRSDLINTKFKVKYRGKDNFSEGFGYQTFYEGEIPDSLVSRNYNRFTLDLGKLKMPNKAVSSGTDVEIEVVAIRSLGERSAQQTLRWKSRIPRNR
ncbi:collagen-like protein [Okeanomitos corallinicola TIOX110]|uniref:Collagen-like protein n=1 Tax=Okeanomitos corallinicola TIOX110 TaxID=3133117 RepID=A0ABZ2V0V3_9CYAN